MGQNSPGNGCSASDWHGPKCSYGHGGGGGGSAGHRAWSLDQKHAGHALAVGGHRTGLGSMLSVATNQEGDRPSFCKTSLLPRIICRQEEGSTAYHLGSHLCLVVALIQTPQPQNQAWAREEHGAGRADSLGKHSLTMKTSSLPLWSRSGLAQDTSGQGHMLLISSPVSRNVSKGTA